MRNHLVAAGILAAGLAALPLSLRATQKVEPAERARACLHAPLEVPTERARREDALKFAERVNRAEQGAARLAPGRPRGEYKPLDQLPNVPPTPAGFRLQLNADGATYAFVLKDGTDPCQYAIFSDQDLAIYEGTPRSGVHVLPLGTP